MFFGTRIIRPKRACSCCRLCSGSSSFSLFSSDMTGLMNSGMFMPTRPGSGRADRLLLILILSVAVIFQPHCPVDNSCSLPFPLLIMDSKQATRKLSVQASWLIRVICNREKNSKKNKDLFQFFHLQWCGSGIQCFFDPGIWDG